MFFKNYILKKIFKDEDLLISSGDEDMNSIFLTSSSSSMKCSPLPISNISSGVGGTSASGPIAQLNNNLRMSMEKILHSDDEYEFNLNSKSDENNMVKHNTITLLDENNRFQNNLLLKAQNNDKFNASKETLPAADLTKFFCESDGSASTETTPAATNSHKSTNFFQYSHDCLPKDLILATASHTITTKTLSKSSSNSSKNSIITTLHTNINESHFSSTTKQQHEKQKQQLQQRINSSSVVRQRSWRTHYKRPNKSFEFESGQTKIVSNCCFIIKNNISFYLKIYFKKSLINLDLSAEL